MKRSKSALALASLAAALLLSPFQSEDASKRIPVQTLCIRFADGAYQVQTDGGLRGFGADPATAFADLERSAPGLPAFSTARQLIIADNAMDSFSELVFLECLHPGTEVYRSAAPVDAGDVTAFLNRHAAGVSVSRLRSAVLTGEAIKLPEIAGAGGRYRICDGK